MAIPQRRKRLVTKMYVGRYLRSVNGTCSMEERYKVKGIRLWVGSGSGHDDVTQDKTKRIESKLETTATTA